MRGMDNRRFHAFLCLEVYSHKLRHQNISDNMATLIDGSSTEIVGTTASVGVTSSVIPEVEPLTEGKDLQRGESVKNAPQSECELTKAEKLFPEDPNEPGKCWYVLRAAFGKAGKAVKALKGETTYFPKRKEIVEVNGKRRKVEKPLIANLLFIYSTKAHIDDLLRDPDLSYISYQYDHTHTDPSGKNPIMTIAHKPMINFINATLTEDANLLVVDPSKHFRFKSNDMVEVTLESFKGVKGRIVRLAGQQRVVVELPGFLSIATPYIPTAFLRKL